MNQARHAVGVQGYGIAERSYQQALAFANDRKQGPTLLNDNDSAGIINHPDVRRMLMTMRSSIEAMRGLALDCAGAFDIASAHPDPAIREASQRRGELLTPLVKGWSTELGVELCSLGVQIHGGMGFIEETGAAQHLRDARIAPIYEGTTAIQANDLIGRKTARDGGQGLGELMSDMQAVLAELHAADDVNLKAVAARMGPAVEAAMAANEWLLGQNDPTLPSATSVEFLMMHGRLAGGWVLARAALAAVAEKKKETVLIAPSVSTSRNCSYLVNQRSSQQIYECTRHDSGKSTRGGRGDFTEPPRCFKCAERGNERRGECRARYLRSR